jgi:geranylgeranyl diphosphate synthase, type II
MTEPAVQEMPAVVAHEVQAAARAVEKHLATYIDTLDQPDLLRDAVRYALLGGGKRLRPALAWMCCQAMGSDGESSLPAGAAVELVHAFSLVHDDLPALDDDDLRRGRPTLHIEFGQAMAVLAGDAMLTLAFDLLHQPPPTGPDPALSSPMTRELARATSAMIDGQVRDTIPETDPSLSDIDRLHVIHHGKTGALIHAACTMGAMCGLGAGHDPDDDRLIAIADYARAVGLMFQIVDDLIDVEHTAEHTGKRTRKDAGAGKLTFPGLLGVEASRQEIERLRVAGVQAVEPMGSSAKPLAAVADYLAARTR